MPHDMPPMPEPPSFPDPVAEWLDALEVDRSDHEEAARVLLPIAPIAALIAPMPLAIRPQCLGEEARSYALTLDVEQVEYVEPKPIKMYPWPPEEPPYFAWASNRRHIMWLAERIVDAGGISLPGR